MAFKVNIKKSAIIGAAAVAAGLLIALGPQFLFKACAPHGGEYSRCHWSVQAVLATGIIIAALGACMVFLSDLKTHIGLNIGIFLAGIITLFIPHWLIKGCSNIEMTCRRVTFPALTILGAAVLAGALAYMIYLGKKTKV